MGLGILDAQHLSPTDPSFCPPLSPLGTPPDQSPGGSCRELSPSLAVPKEAGPRGTGGGAWGCWESPGSADHLKSGVRGAWGGSWGPSSGSCFVDEAQGAATPAQVTQRPCRSHRASGQTLAPAHRRGAEGKVQEASAGSFACKMGRRMLAPPRAGVRITGGKP